MINALVQRTTNTNLSSFAGARVLTDLLPLIYTAAVIMTAVGSMAASQTDRTSPRGPLTLAASTTAFELTPIDLGPLFDRGPIFER